jgi:hypothetical protein
MTENEFVRTCCVPGCGRKITNCSGFVVGRDILAAMQGKTKEVPRELCGRCGVLALFMPQLFYAIFDLHDQIKCLKQLQPASS